METQAKKLYKGNAEIFIPPGKKYVFMADTNTTKISDQNGMPLDFIAKSPGIINVESKSGFWCIDYQMTMHHPADPIPVEVDVGTPEPGNILDRMRQLVKEEIMNRYGANSDEVETMEEFMNFDIDGDGEIGDNTQYTVMEDEFVAPTIAEPAPEPAPEEPAMEPDPAPAPPPDTEPTP